MKIIFYNIAYGTGLKGLMRQYFYNTWRFFWTPFSTLRKIGNMLKAQHPDIVCLAEVDHGSFRNRFRSQAKALGKQIGIKYVESASKYGRFSVLHLLAIIGRQHDAILTNLEGELIRHYFSRGIQRLYFEFVTQGMSVFVVHLAVFRKKMRQRQLRELAERISECPRPYILCGDFNVHGGVAELKGFLEKTKANLVKTDMTYPSHKPNRTIDLFFHGPGIRAKGSGTIDVDFSDHLPVWAEFERIID